MIEEVNIYCGQHSRQKVQWVCLERECCQRVMCSSCAVKSHDKSHKLEEIQQVMSNGLLNSFRNNANNQSVGLQSLCEGEGSSEEVSDELSLNLDRNIKRLLSEMERVRGELRKRKQENEIRNEQRRQKIVEFLSGEDEKLRKGLEEGNLNLNELDSLIENGFNVIAQYSDLKDREFMDVRSSSEGVIKKKLEVLNLMETNYVTTVNAYFQNDFVNQVCSLFEEQLKTIDEDKLQHQQQEVGDPYGFLDFVAKRWSQDYQNIIYSIQRFVGRLNEGLRYSLQMPLQQQQQQQPIQQQQQPIPQQRYYHPQPLMMVHTPQMVYVQPQQTHYIPQQYTSPKNTSKIMAEEHMVQSQIIYAPHDQSPIPRIEVQPICQREQPLKPKSRISKAEATDHLQKMNSALSNYINKISNK